MNQDTTVQQESSVRGVKHPEKLAPFETGLPDGGLLLQCRILVHF